jgi:rsbT co-antagonist protein RsbR
MHNNLERTAFRVQVLAVVEMGLLALILIVDLIVFPKTRLLVSLLCAIGILAAGATYGLRRSAFVEQIVYLNFLVMLAILAVVDPLSGTLGGATWTLYQLMSPVAALVLRKPRATILVTGASASTLLAVAVLQISGVVPVELLTRPEVLWFNLSMQILMMIALASIISVITGQQQRAYATAIQLSAAREQQLAENQRLLDLQGTLNQELRASLEQVQLRDEQLRDEQALRHDLLRTVDALAAPVIPISDEIVVAPLVGAFDETRLSALSGELLDQIARRQARTLILDVTGLVAFDTATARALLDTVNSCRLMGTRTMIVGVQPEIAQTIVGLGIDLEHIATRSTLQEAIRHALTDAWARRRSGAAAPIGAVRAL